ncbi:MAG: hypothetical protein WC337_01935 [Candidatus Muiribacteriota bacterium]
MTESFYKKQRQFSFVMGIIITIILLNFYYEPPFKHFPFLMILIYIFNFVHEWVHVVIFNFFGGKCIYNWKYFTPVSMNCLNYSELKHKKTAAILSRAGALIIPPILIYFFLTFLGKFEFLSTSEYLNFSDKFINLMVIVFLIVPVGDIVEIILLLTKKME